MHQSATHKGFNLHSIHLLIKTSALLSIATLSVSNQQGFAARSATELLAERFTGQYSTGKQAEETRGGFTHVNFIGCSTGAQGFDLGTQSLGRVIYEERHFEVRPVHYQRILLLIPAGENKVEMRIHQVKEPHKFLGLCRTDQASQFLVKPTDLQDSVCSQFFTLQFDQDGNDTWIGETPEEGCPSAWFPGSAKMTSYVEIPAERAINVWGKFYDASGNQVGGVDQEPYRYLNIADEKQAKAPIESFLKRFQGFWKGNYKNVSDEGITTDTFSFEQNVSFEDSIFKSETEISREEKLIQLTQKGAITPDGRLLLSNVQSSSPSQSVCRMQAFDAMACVTFNPYAEDIKSAPYSKELYVLQNNDTVRTLTTQTFKDKTSVSFGFSEAQRK